MFSIDIRTTALNQQGQSTDEVYPLNYSQRRTKRATGGTNNVVEAYYAIDNLDWAKYVV